MKTGQRIIKWVGVFISLVIGFQYSLLFAEENPTPNENNASSANRAGQFQAWLKNNGQGVSSPTTLVNPPSTTITEMNTAPVAHMEDDTSAAADNSKTAVTSTTDQSGKNTPPSPPSLVIVPPAQGMPLTFSQSQQNMLDSAPPSPIPTSSDSNTAFNAMMEQNMPLSPKQVVRLHQAIDVSQRAAAVPANVPPKPVSSTLMINLAPGTTPPAIRLAQGYVSSLVFVDSTGAPWPIDSYDIGNPKAANIQWDGKSNILIIQAMSPYSDGNIVVRLMKLPTPITLELVSGQREVDYRADIHVSGLGPNSKDLPIGTHLPDNANELLLGVLDRIPPPGSKQLTVKGGDCQAWLLGDKMYLHTRLTLLSPGWTGKMVSPDGMNAYEVIRASSILVSQYGEPLTLKIEGF